MSSREESQNMELGGSKEEEEEDMIPCDCIGALVFTDNDERKFYTAYTTCNLTVNLGDGVRVLLQDDKAEQGIFNNPSFGFGQVVAIYELQDEVFVELRWFTTPEELTPYHRKMINPVENELIETDQMDDIPAGAVSEVISIKGVGHNPQLTSDFYVCRYFHSNNSRAIQKVPTSKMFQRGMEYSNYKFAYAEYLQEQGGGVEDDYMVAMQRLHISVIPDTLPCRQNERSFIENYLRDGVKSGNASPLYICGMPGTGKTATLLSCINNLRKEVEAGTLDNFSFIEINCLRLKSPPDAYTQLWRGLSGYHLSAQAAQRRLASYFSEKLITTVGQNTKRKGVLICLMDELDFLITRDFKIIYNFFDWPTQQDGFILVGIANTMDLPERISTRVESRAKLLINRLIFSPYTHEQVKEILEERLSALSLSAFDNKAREFVARKASSTAGDLRAALKICQTTIEMYRDLMLQQEKDQKLQKTTTTTSTAGNVNTLSKIFAIVNAAVNRYKETPFISVVSRMSQLEKAIILCFCKHRKLICGGDDHSSLAGLTMLMAWDRFQDLLQKVSADEFYGANSTSNTAISGSTASASAAVPKAPASAPAQRITLRCPPLHVFQQCLSKLEGSGVLNTTTAFRACGRPVVHYHVNSSFLYSDFVAAINQDPLTKFVSIA